MSGYRLDELLDAPDSTSTPTRARRDTSTTGSGFALDDLLSDTASASGSSRAPIPDPAAAPVTPRPNPPRAVYSGGKLIEQNGAPVRGRGIVDALGDVIDRVGGFFGDVGKYGPGQEQSGGTTASRYEEPEGDYTLLHPADRRTAEQRAAQARARYEGPAASDVTRVAPAGSPVSRLDRAKTQAGLRTQAAQEAAFTPKNLRRLANEGDYHADQLFAEADSIAPHDAARAELLRQQAQDAKARAANAETVASASENADTFGEIARSSLLGIVHDPNAPAKRAMLDYAVDPSLSFSPEEQTRGIGLPEPVGRSRGFDVAKDVSAPLLGSLPLYVAGGAAGRLLTEGAATALEAANAPRAASLARALSAEIETSGIYGPKQAGIAGLREAGANFAENAGKLAARGATQGQVVGAVQAAREAQQMGTDPIEAAATSAIMNVPFGVAGELGLGGMARVLGVADRSVAGALDRVRSYADGLRGVPEGEYMEAIGKTRPVEQPLVAAMDQGAAVAGKLPVSDKTLEGQRVELAKALERALAEKKEAPNFGSDAGLIERDPNYLTPQPERVDENPPLRTSRDVAMERAGYDPNAVDPNDPLVQANAMHQMQRAAEEQRSIDAQMREQDANARLEQAALQREQEQQGPRALGDVIERAASDRDAGEPLAADYHDAISKFADVQARMEDATTDGKQAGAKLRLDYARARATLNEMRRKYGVQVGGAALLALSQHDSDLSDEEKQWLGIGGGLALATGVVKHLPPELHGRALAAMDRVQSHETASAQTWLEHLAFHDAPFGEHYPMLKSAMEKLSGEYGDEIPAQAVRNAINDMAQPAYVAPAKNAPVPTPLVSRLAKAVETLPGKAWDAPRPAADWLGKLKGLNTFSKAELALVEPALKEAQANKVKLTRAEVTKLVELHSPNIERAVLSRPDTPSATHVHVEAGGDMTDFAQLEHRHEAGDLPPHEIATEMNARRDRIADLRSDIASQREDAESTFESAENNLERQRRDLREAIENFGPDADVDRAMNAIIDSLQNDIEVDHIPRNAIDRAFEAAIEEGSLHANDELRDPEDDGTFRDNDDGSVTFIVSGNEYTAPTRWEAAAKAEHEGDWDSGSRDHILPQGSDVIEVEHARGKVTYPDGSERGGIHRNMTHAEAEAEARTRYPTARYEPDGYETRYVLRNAEGQQLDESRAGQSREDFIDEYVRDHADLDDGEALYSTLKNEIEYTAQRISEWNEAESARWDADEGERFRDEESEIEQLEDENRSLTTMYAEAAARERDARNAPRLGAGEDAGEQAAEPEPDAGDPYLDPVEPPTPKGEPEYATYQRIGGGREYVELPNIWTNPPGDKYHGGHYKHSNPGTVSHVRMETQDVRDVPGLGPKIEYPAGEPESARLTRSQIAEVRKKIATREAEAGEIAREVEAMPPSERDERNPSQRALDLMRQFRDIAQHVKDLAERHAQLGDKLAEELEHYDAKPVRVLIESQSDYAQDAGKYGIKRVPTDAERAEYAKAVESLNEERDRLFTENTAGYEERREASRQWTALRSDLIGDGRAQDGDILHPVDMSDVYAVNDDDRAQSARDRERAYAIDPRFREIMERYEAAHRRVNESGERSTAIAQQIEALGDRYGINQSSSAVPEGIFAETKAAHGLNVARALGDAADGGYATLAWSDSMNRVQKAQPLTIPAATLTYDKLIPGIVKSMLAGLGFKDVPIEKMYIRGYGHWKIDLTPEMRRAIRKNGLPVLGVLGAIAASPDDASAQDGRPHRMDLYATHAGALAAGALIGAMMTSRKLRAMVKENRELSRALHLDDLSGLSNKRALSRAIESVDKDPSMGWIVLDGNRFKAMNDTHGHPEGDKAIAHFGKVVRDAAEKTGVPMRGFRAGGDEFAFAAPKAKIAEVMKAIEDGSPYTKGEGSAKITTSLTGAFGDNFAEADAMLNAVKEANRRADPSLRRPGETHVPEVIAQLPEAEQENLSPEIRAAIEAHDARAAIEQFATESGAHYVAPRSGVGAKTLGQTLYANPIGPALAELRRAPGVAGLAALGAVAQSQDDNPYVQRMGVPLMALAALHAIGARRLGLGVDKLADGLVEQLRKSASGTAAVRLFNPDRLLSPEVRTAIRQFERDRATATAVASRAASKAKALGPQGDRAVSDVLDREAWEGIAAQTPEVLSVAVELADEYDKATKAQLAAGTLTPDQVIKDYGGPRKYAHYEVAYALADKPGKGGGASSSPRIAKTNTRTLDIPIREAQAKLDHLLNNGGSAAEIKAAQQELDFAEYESASKRVERGEIREASYRAAAGIEKAYHNVAASKLFESLRATPGVAHPEWIAAVDDYQTATAIRRSAVTQADKDAADLLVGNAASALDELERRYRQKGQQWKALPNTPAWGMLRGAIVQRDVANSLEGFGDLGWYTKALRAWKEVHTVFNTGTSVGNILSNVAALHVGDVPAWLQPLYYKKALADLKSYGEAAQALTEAGLMHVNATTAEGQGAMTTSSMRSATGLEELLGTTRPETADVIRRESEKNSEYAITEPAIADRTSRRIARGAAIGGAVGALKGEDDEHPERAELYAAIGMGLGALAASGKGDVIRRIYGHEDNIARMAIFLRRRALGDSKDVALQAAIDGLGDFRTRSPALRMTQNFLSPFILYQAKAVPAFAAKIIDHPYKYLTLVALWAGLNEYSKQAVGEVPEEDRDERDRATWGYFFPGFTQLPLANEDGDKGAVDMARYTPFGGFATGAPPGSVPEALTPDAPQVATPGGPLIDLALRAANVHPLTKRPLLNRDRSPSENIHTLLQEATDFGLPSAMGYYVRQLQTDYDNRDFARLKNDLLGPVGARPRYVRAGAPQQAARHELQQSLNEIKYQLRRDLDANKNPTRDSVLIEAALERQLRAMQNFERRTSAPPKGERP